MTTSASSAPAAEPPAGILRPASGPGARTATGLLLATVVIALAGVALTVLAWSALGPSDRSSNLGAAAAAVAYAVLGALIVSRASNAVGWLLIAEGMGLATMALTSAYAVAGIRAHPGSLPAARQVGATSEWAFFALVTVLVLALLLFPSGTLPSRRWRPVVAVTLLGNAVLLAAFIVAPGRVALPAPGGVSLTYPNPFSHGTIGHAPAVISLGSLNPLTLLLVVLLGAAAASMVRRYRAGASVLRRQIKWVALLGATFGVLQLVALAGIVADHGQIPPFAAVAYTGTELIALFGLPVVIAIAILKYRLYEIDVIINRAVVYGLVSAGLTAVYAGIVLGIGALAGRHSTPTLTIIAAAAVALLFQPLRARAQRVANRLVYGDRATPYQVLSDFADDMAGQLDYDKAVDRMVAVLASATGATRTEAWIRIGAELRPFAVWPGGSVPPGPVSLADTELLPAFEAVSRAVAVRHGSELLGALALEKPRNEPLTVAEDKLLQHLASQAGLVFRNSRLTAELQSTIAELRASRRRMVEAQDAERRRIERNLHDGAQQQLVSLSIQLGLLEESAGDAAAVREMTPQLRTAVRAALDDLRDLARGIYPPLLAERGLVPALQAQARRAVLPVVIEADGVGRYPRDAETTVYFCALEALQNIAKYASASQATVRLSCSASSLRLTVTDDGAGFDTASARSGSGLQGMADRLAALGGTLDVRSRPGHGTTLTGQLPVPDCARA
ncbi:MAG TPA: sensor histidine kinase [Streptosporangiaceae bacterium]|jgi:signal transduction histidine kinase